MAVLALVLLDGIVRTAELVNQQSPLHSRSAAVRQHAEQATETAGAVYVVQTAKSCDAAELETVVLSGQVSKLAIDCEAAALENAVSSGQASK